MKKIGTYQERKVYWSNYKDLLHSELPNSDWICLLTSSGNKPDEKLFDEFTRRSIEKGILEFKGHGEFGELLHDWFDETIVIMETMEKHPKIEVMTTWHNNQTFADVFWQCFFATCLPETTNYNNIKIICSDLDGINRANELSDYLVRFDKGWLPKDKPSNWKPILFDELDVLIKLGVNKMSVDQKEFWHQIQLNPIKWEEKEYGKEGNGFWVVGKYQNKVIWYNDVEEGFNISPFTQVGLIDEYGAEQDELQWTIQRLKRHHNKGYDVHAG